MSGKPGLYALYRGDEFVDVGTAGELALRRSVSAEYIRWLATREARRRRKSEAALLAYRLEDES